MGNISSCPIATFNDFNNGLHSIIVESVCLGGDEVKTPERSVSFKAKDDSGNMAVEGSASFKKRRESETSISVVTSPLSINKAQYLDHPSPQSVVVAHSGSLKDEAAVRLQKVYKHFRTRRKLADCAVLVEQSWPKILDFAELKSSSISFFESEHNETAVSRWARAKIRAARVGKGLSKNGKARKLAVEHWLEAIDPRHRHGHNLCIYYTKWHESQSREPFFYWLDIGEGKQVVSKRCSRMKLVQQCIKYLGPLERRCYEVSIENAKFVYKASGELLDTSSEPHAEWIFVLSTSKNLYVGKKKKGTFQHSSFLAGGVTLAAGRLVVENGVLKAVWPHSGHYRPTPKNFGEFLSFLRDHNVEQLKNVKTLVNNCLYASLYMTQLFKSRIIACARESKKRGKGLSSHFQANKLGRPILGPSLRCWGFPVITEVTSSDIKEGKGPSPCFQATGLGNLALGPFSRHRGFSDHGSHFLRHPPRLPPPERICEGDAFPKERRRFCFKRFRSSSSFKFTQVSQGQFGNAGSCCLHQGD